MLTLPHILEDSNPPSAVPFWAFVIPKKRNIKTNAISKFFIVEPVDNIIDDITSLAKIKTRVTIMS
jgi:hypothetical protein